MRITAHEHFNFEVTREELVCLSRQKLVALTDHGGFAGCFGGVTAAQIRDALHEIREPLYPAMRALIFKIAELESADQVTDLIDRTLDTFIKEAIKLKARMQ